MPDLLPGWRRLPETGNAGPGRRSNAVFQLGRYKDGLQAVVSGSRGFWVWLVERQLPLVGPNGPLFVLGTAMLQYAPIASGETNTQRKAQLAAEAAITAARRAAGEQGE